MGEQERMARACARLATAYRMGMELSKKLRDIFEDDGGVADISGLVEDAMITLAGEDDVELWDAVVHKYLETNMDGDRIGKSIANYIEIRQSVERMKEVAAK